MTVAANPVRILIVDDEDLARQRLRALLSRRADFEIVGECATGVEAVKAIREIAPEIVVLDVQMPELDGFDVVS
jgi:two-component system LytT family response regulator